MLLCHHLVVACFTLVIGASAARLSIRQNPNNAGSGSGNRNGTGPGPAFQFGTDHVRGVNAGGWLVLEPWITPSMFENKPEWVVDEWTYGAYMRTQNNTMGEIRAHWNDWITYADFEAMKKAGLNTVRIQIGFWSIIPLANGEPFLTGAYPYLKVAVDWAQTLGLKVMIDLHGAPGSQNGFDNSAIRTTREWFRNSTNLDRTIFALSTLSSDFTSASYNRTVIAIELINEPFPQSPDEVGFLRDFYQRAYRAVRGASQDTDMVVALDAAFQGLNAWEGFMLPPDYYEVAMDTHLYSMFDLKLLEMGYTANLNWVCDQRSYLGRSNRYHWTIVGEWTLAHTDCARWLNGRGRGARWDNSLTTSDPLPFPGNCRDKTGPGTSRFSSDYKDFLARSFETQTYVYEQASGWIMWTWKTEEAPEWSLMSGIQEGWIPTPIDSRPHGEPCQDRPSSARRSHPFTDHTTTINKLKLFAYLLLFTAVCTIITCF